MSVSAVSRLRLTAGSSGNPESKQHESSISIKPYLESEVAMKYNIRLMMAALAVAGLQLTACQKQHAAHHAEHPAEVKKIEGSNLSSVTLTESAMKRLDVKTDQVREMDGKRVVPYSSLIYDPKGGTWVYTNPEPRTFVRHKIDIDRIDGNAVILNDGPPAGTAIASVAVAEIYGAEFKVGH